jgi:predicted Zn-dependent protease
MKKILPILLVITFLVIESCSKVPITNRRQLNLLPESEMLAMSYQEYDRFLKENTVLQDVKYAKTVKKVGMKMAFAVKTFLDEIGESKRIEGYEWEFNLVKDDQINAWCMPGGKVVFYTGILPICKDEKGLAVVMSHEIAHAIGRHGNERMSQGLALQLGGLALSKALETKPEATHDLFLQAYGIGGTLGVLKFGRNQESEADKMGLVFMAIAGYNPEEAIKFWERMSKMSAEAPPEMLSTHPSDETRIQDIKDYLPEAMKYYKP